MSTPTHTPGVQARLDSMLVENKDQHVYRLNRAAFTDAELFELEVKHLFEGNWIYLAASRS
jgi:benzoate/toluate 1,2-dioxygenase subunit alpha